jgi:hypothetical protein
MDTRGFMTRRRRIHRLLLFAAIGGIVIAVQRDTFLRRWLVPPPQPRPLLDKVVPFIHFEQTVDARPIEHLAKVAGMHIELPAGSRVDLTPSDRIVGSTVDRILMELLVLRSPLNSLIPYEADGVIRFRVPNKKHVMVRCYDLSDLLPPIGAVSHDRLGKPRSARAKSFSTLQGVYYFLSESPNADDVSLFGNTVIVRGGEREQRVMRLLLESFRKDEKARRILQTGSDQ